MTTRDVTRYSTIVCVLHFCANAVYVDTVHANGAFVRCGACLYETNITMKCLQQTIKQSR